MPAVPERRLQRRALDRAFQLMAEQVADGVAPFVILGVADARGVIRLEAATAPGGPAVGTDAVSLVASITKPIMATAILQLVAEGRLQLSTPLGELVPELEAAGRPPITAWHVLTHTSGLGDIDVEPVILSGGGRAELLRRVHALPQDDPPGARFRYVSASFELLAAALERIDGVPHEEALRRRVLEPLGMTSTSFRPTADPVLAPRVAPVGVGSWDGVPSAVSEQILDGFTALRLSGGGLWSSAPDLLRFGRAMLRGGELDGARVLPRAHVELMTREAVAESLDGSPDPLAVQHYALGWGKPGIATPGSRSAFGHGGITGTRLWVDPEHDLVLVYLTGAWGFPDPPRDAAVSAVYAALD